MNTRAKTNKTYKTGILSLLLAGILAQNVNWGKRLEVMAAASIISSIGQSWSRFWKKKNKREKKN